MEAGEVTAEGTERKRATEKARCTAEKKARYVLPILRRGGGSGPQV